MKGRPSVHVIGLMVFILTLLISATGSPAADFTLAWDPTSNDFPNLIGYNLYFKEGSSILANQDNSEMIYIPLTEAGFAPDQPSYQITGLQDNVRYYFIVTAMYQDEESDMSNEVSGIQNSSSSPDTNLKNGYITASEGTSEGGCFINSLN